MKKEQEKQETGEEGRKLTNRQKAWVREYLVDLNATQAAIRAGYGKKNAKQQGAENLSKPDLKALIDVELEKRARQSDITAEQVRRELGLIAFADMSTYLKFGDNGQVFLDWSHLPDGATRVISEIVQDEYWEGGAEEGRQVRRTRFRLHPKLKALELLARHLVMFRDVSEIDLGGSVWKELVGAIREGKR